MSSEDFLQAKAEELLNELNQVATQLASLKAEYSSIEEALNRLEKLGDVDEVFERIGVIYVKRDRESVIVELKATKEALEATIKSLEKKERDLRETLNRMLQPTQGS
ncbi:MAG: prefoldin subunit [Candidatus Korarchaeota archaeon]|nr:prefoldin subunit [Candidatus Korarchaeota archaeon]